MRRLAGGPEAGTGLEGLELCAGDGPRAARSAPRTQRPTSSLHLLPNACPSRGLPRGPGQDPDAVTREEGTTSVTALNDLHMQT